LLYGAVMKKTALALTLISALLLVATVLHFPSLASANPVPYPSEPNKESPTLKVDSPQNGEVYTGDTVELVFAVTKPDSWNHYWLGVTSGLPVIGDYLVWVYLDGDLNCTFWDPNLRDTPTTDYSVVLDGLAEGGHKVKIDVVPRTFYENQNPGPRDTDYFSYQLDNVSDTIHFTVNSDLLPSPSPPLEPTSTPEPASEPFPTAVVAAASGVSAIFVGIGLLVYFKKTR
jgi:hypothetical protein